MSKSGRGRASVKGIVTSKYRRDLGLTKLSFGVRRDSAGEPVREA